MMIRIGDNGHGDSTAPALQIHSAVATSSQRGNVHSSPVRNLLPVRLVTARAGLEFGAERML
ncbi:MAG: hypothetical protein JO189_29950 [Deltaproteobacteria bacterium]|nr:hypothetical protein [Deltaproteobacteria bacterium]